jgi:hypothetical protein
MRDVDRASVPVSDAPMLDFTRGEICAVIRKFCDMRSVSSWLEKAVERSRS